MSSATLVYFGRRYIPHIASILLFLTPVAQAQTPVSPRQGAAIEPEIVVSGTADVSAESTKAAFEIEIKTLAATAAAASAENARVSRAVMDALHSAGLRADEIEGTQLSVGANWSYDASVKRQKRSTYQANNSIRVKTSQLEKVAIYFDAALSAGATGVTLANYFAEDPEGMRRKALGEAVAAARRDAEVIAQAGGGRLGELQLLTTDPESALAQRVESMDRMFKRSTSDEVTELVAPKITVTARVVARWRFLPNVSAK